MPAKQAVTIQERFERFVEPEPNSGCHLWAGAINDDGYGWFTVGGKNIRAHRAAYELYVGPIPAGLQVLHLCDQPSCVSAVHLFLGTPRDNQGDKALKNRGTTSRVGRPYGVKFDRRPLKNPYFAQVRVNGKMLFLGRFSTAAEAGRVAADWKVNHYHKPVAIPATRQPEKEFT